MTPYVARYGWLLFAAAVVVILDQVTKQLALEALADGSVMIIPGVLSLRLAFNPGGAFGILQGLPGFFLVATGIVVIVILIWAHKLEDRGVIPALGMVLGGGLGNLTDRLFRDFDGRVVDYIHLRFWPTFNVADMAIVLGVAVILIRSVVAQKREGEAGDERAPSESPSATP